MNTNDLDDKKLLIKNKDNTCTIWYEPRTITLRRYKKVGSDDN